MLNIRPVRKALVPVDSAAAQCISGPNYDEFQSNHEIFQVIKLNPENILSVTMPHCAVCSEEDILVEGSIEALDKAAINMEQLVTGDMSRIFEDVLWVYEIEDKSRPEVRQIGLGCMAVTLDIRTDKSPQGSIIRNEGIRKPKAEGRADLMKKIRADVGVVNHGIEDRDNRITATLESYADSIQYDYKAIDENNNIHKVWLVTEPGVIDKFVELFKEEECAYVADGNHRSAAANMVGLEGFLAVFFKVDRLKIAPYNRLVKKTGIRVAELEKALDTSFEIEKLEKSIAFQPQNIHETGLYTSGMWYKLKPRTSTYNPENVVETIDANIIQRKIFNDILHISNPTDYRINFVGDNKSVSYLVEKVDNGNFDYAFTLAPVTMEQFILVCRQNCFMPPKSTWFEPKIRSGLLVALLDEI